MSHVHYYRCLDSSAKPTRINTVTYIKGDSASVCHCIDGSLQLFDFKGYKIRP